MKIFQRGQVALVVLLVSAVALTLGLSLSKKTVTETNIETDEEALKQAFNAAESGIDYYLSTGTTKYAAPDGDSLAEISVEDVGGATIDFGGLTLANNYNYFWLVGHNSDGSINYGDNYSGTEADVCVDGGFTGSLVIGYFFRDGGGEIRQRRYVYNYGLINVIPNPSSLDSGSCSSGQGVRLDLEGEPLAVVVTPVFGSTGIRMENVGGGIFPTQGKEITSVGQAGEVNTSGSVKRKLSINKRYLIPGFMIEAIGSGRQVLN